MNTTLSALTLLVFVASPIRAQQGPPKFGCEDKPAFRQFDFWVGEWDVRVTGTEQVAGTNSVQLINGSCTILENWTGARGGVGKSINFYNAATSKWQQTWVDNVGGVMFFVGGRNGNAMKFDGEHVKADGTTSKIRLTFINIAPDTVRQIGESTVDGKQWTTRYDLTYVRRK
jgi:hypothetical protein